MIPAQETNGSLPPFIGTDPRSQAVHSPFATTPEELVARFATSPKRIDIALGWLDYRAALASAGLAFSYQWLGGSYCEVMAREPNDIDVVTFFLPGPTLKAAATSRSKLLVPSETKVQFKCDAYPVELAAGKLALVEVVRYWYALFAHRRDRTWKGMLQIPMDAAADANARAALLTAAASAPGSGP